MPSDYDPREDYAYDAWLERVGNATVGYHKDCGGRVFAKTLRGKRTATEGQLEPDERWLECSKCGCEVDDDGVSEEEVEVE